MAFEMDFISYYLNYLTIFICILMILRRIKIYKHNNLISYFLICVRILLISLFISFLVKRVLLFYFFFEFSLIPTIFLILGWGYQIERVQATLYFLIYTLFSSLPLLIIILKFNSLTGNFNFSYELTTIKTFESSFLNLVLFWCCSGAFLVKLPIYIFHLWLPKAHVEAPVRGSIILAAVLLKLGGYGLIRITPLVKIFYSNISFYLVSISLLSLSYISITCIRRNDLKSLIAYSSVAHMALALAGILTVVLMGLNGHFLILIGHGVCSSGLFSYVNMLYERSSSRSLYINKGVIHYSMIAASFIFILCILNIGAPPSINLFSELFLFSSIIRYRSNSIRFIFIGSLLVAGYCIFLFRSSHHGKLFNSRNGFFKVVEIEYIILTRHTIPLFISFVFINLIT